MIALSIEYQPRCPTPGTEVEGFLVLTLSTTHHISSVQLSLRCEVVVRRIKTIPSFQDTIAAKTYRTFPMNIILNQLLHSPLEAETLDAGRYKYPFKFKLPPEVPASLWGSKAGKKPKYEINYWAEACVTENVSILLGIGWHEKFHKERFYFHVYEKPNLHNFPNFLPDEPVEIEEEVEVIQGWRNHPVGHVAFKFYTEHPYQIAGKDFTFDLTIENKTKEPIIKIFTTLRQIFEYNIPALLYQKHKVIEVEKKEHGIPKISSGETKTKNLQVYILSNMPATTPTVFEREIKIQYEIMVEICLKSCSQPVFLFSHEILVSSLAFV